MGEGISRRDILCHILRFVKISDIAFREKSSYMKDWDLINILKLTFSLHLPATVRYKQTLERCFAIHLNQNQNKLKDVACLDSCDKELCYKYEMVGWRRISYSNRTLILENYSISMSFSERYFMSLLIWFSWQNALERSCCGSSSSRNSDSWKCR